MGWVVNATPRPLYHRKKNRYPLHRRAVLDGRGKSRLHHGLQQTPVILNSYFLWDHCHFPGWMTVQDWWNDNWNSLGGTPVPVLPCRPQPSHALPWDRRQRDQTPKQWYGSTKRRTPGCDSGRTSMKQGTECTDGRTARCLHTSTFNFTF